jgi:outer membrane protein TolC
MQKLAIILLRHCSKNNYEGKRSVHLQFLYKLKKEVWLITSKILKSNPGIKIFLALMLLINEMQAQQMNLATVLNNIDKSNPVVKAFDAQITSLNETAKGAKAWMAPELSTGFFATPYNPSLWRKGPNGTTGMGQYSIAAQQIIPNKSRLNAEYKYMNAMSTVEKENKGASLNELYADAKRSYFEWVIILKKLSVLDDNERVLNFMVSNAQIRYKNGLEKISAYYKAKAALSTIQNIRLTLQNEIRQKRILINTLMNLEDKNKEYTIDTNYTIKDYSTYVLDSAYLTGARSDIKAIEKDINLTYLKQDLERKRLRPEFGIRYENMIGFGGQPGAYTLMGMVRIPFARWSAKMYKANIEGLKWQAVSLNSQKQQLINQYTGAAYGVKAELDIRKKKIQLFKDNILPALQKNFQTMQLGYEQNTEELFTLYDAWEVLNITQLEYFDELQQLLVMQVEMERILQIK